MTTMIQSKLSPALSFLSAAVDALPKTLGDRDRSGIYGGFHCYTRVGAN